MLLRFCFFLSSIKHPSHVTRYQSLHVDLFIRCSLSCKSLCVLTPEPQAFYFSLKINIYRRQLSLGEVSLQEFPVWGPKPLTRPNIPFQMKAAVRETVLFGPSSRALPSDSRNVGCLEWGSGSEERMPAMSMFVQGWLSIQLPVTCCDRQRV